MWKQIEADVTGVPVVTTQQADAGALGAAILAGVGIGEFGSISEGINATVVVDRVYEPNPRTSRGTTNCSNTMSRCTSHSSRTSQSRPGHDDDPSVLPLSKHRMLDSRPLRDV